MKSKVTPFAATPDPTHRQRTAPARPDAAQAGATEGASGREADLRLVIEEDRASGSFLYKTIDRATGEVVQQFPREAVLRMSEDDAYAAGGVIRTKA